MRTAESVMRSWARGRRSCSRVRGHRRRWSPSPRGSPWYCRRHAARRTPRERPSRADGMRLADGRHHAHLHWIRDPLDRHGGFPQPEHVARSNTRFGRPMASLFVPCRPTYSIPVITRSRITFRTWRPAARGARLKATLLMSLRGGDAGREAGGFGVRGQDAHCVGPGDPVWSSPYPIAIRPRVASIRRLAAQLYRRRRRPRAHPLAGGGR